VDSEGRESHVRGFYEQEAAAYDEDRWTTPAGIETGRVQSEIARAMLERAPRGLFLELGAGTGRFAATLASRERPCVALDIAPAMLAKTTGRAAAEGTRAHLRPVQASGLRLPFANSSLGACLSLNVFSHLPDAEATLAELSRVIRPGGLLALNFPNAISPYLPYAVAVKATGRSLRKGVHTRWYTPAEVRRILADAHFTVVDTWGQLHYPWARGGIVRHLLGKADAAVRHGRLAQLGSILFVLAQRA
jgi:ubiquinone/menaquinone biosynthesis C-methylase UbiE